MTTGPLLGVSEPLCRRCGLRLSEHAVFHDPPTAVQLQGRVAADFGPPFDGLYCQLPEERHEAG